MQEDFEQKLKIAVFIRTVRGILGYSQKVFAEKLGIPQSTITRAEVMETNIRYTDYMKILESVRELGIEFDEQRIPMTFKLNEPIFDLALKQIENRQKIKDLKKNAP